MPELVEQMYCSQQIVIPPKFPYILKRYCKAAIKTQPYDLLRWSFEYFRALAQRRPPPVKLRLEYPVYSTEGGLTRGCLKVLANQLSGMSEVPLSSLRAAWQGFCLDPTELGRVLCLCEVYMRSEVVPFLHFIAVAGGLLTKSLTHTMVLLCETLTKEPDGGSAAIPVQDLMTMYQFLAKMDASANVKYINGYREGWTPPAEEAEEEEEVIATVSTTSSESLDDYWAETSDLQKIGVTNDYVPRTSQFSTKLNMPIVGNIERSPSIERATEIERQTYMMDRTGKPEPDDEVEKKLKEISAVKLNQSREELPEAPSKVKEENLDEIRIEVLDEEGKPLPYEFYGEPVEVEEDVIEDPLADALMAAKETKSVTAAKSVVEAKSTIGQEQDLDVDQPPTEAQMMKEAVNLLYQAREERREDLSETFDQIAALVDRYKSANYDLGMVAGRQMSTTSGEFIVQHIERQIMDYINEQIAILPDPDLKKKKAKPEEVQMIRELLENFLDENMETIVPEVEEVEEEEEPIPDIVMVYAVPGIGGPVDDDTIREFEDYALDVSRVQADLFMPRNIRHFMCPPLEKYVEYIYEGEAKKEEVPVGGIITD